MSIPGLGQIAPTSAPSAATASTASPTETHRLQPFWEYRFEVPLGSTLTIKLLAGTAEKDGTELAPNTAYEFSATKSKINTWHGCTLEVKGPGGTNASYDAYISEPSAEETPLISYLNLHFKLEGMRSAAARGQGQGQRQGRTGPRVMVVGPPSAGKSSLVRTLAGWATRVGRQPLVVNTDPREGMLALPGTLSAAAFATIPDITNDWGVSSTPMSGPSAVPVKLPLAYYYGLERPDDNPRLYRSVCGALAAAANARLAGDPDARAAGMLIDTPGVAAKSSVAAGSEVLENLASEFDVNVVVVLGSERMSGELARRFAGRTTALGETVSVVGLAKSGGVVERDAVFMQGVRERAIREYFFGDARNTLSPFTQQVEFDALSVWKVNAAPSPTSPALPDNDDSLYDPAGTVNTMAPDVEKVEPCQPMQNCTLAVVYAPPTTRDPVHDDANVMGFVYVADVDEKKRRLRVLAPVSARLGDRPLLWGPWPEPMVSLLG
ncbi:hypothetical protein DL764_007918 [Monosporascus ibericus]|uniref:Polynucleotide 5'-hydroxyl-kinase GRC3 n=1 Tax=Monosporascus ibericus TaxID=155417 RepID=A0A4Q4T1M0_9PEZI|nr:hypothetical protein DL764_007918 [Monosporascus ibericus]